MYRYGTRSSSVNSNSDPFPYSRTRDDSREKKKKEVEAERKGVHMVAHISVSLGPHGVCRVIDFESVYSYVI